MSKLNRGAYEMKMVFEKVIQSEIARVKSGGGN